MACNCSNVICLYTPFNPCGEGAEVDITPDETGNWTGDIEFAAGHTSFSVGVISGQKLVIPVVLLNENYNHDLRLYKIDGTMVNNSCYVLRARAIVNSTDYPVLPADSTDVFNYEVTVAGTSITYPHFGDGEVLLLSTDAQDYDQDFFTQAGDTLTSKLNADGEPFLTFYPGQLIVVTLKFS